MGAALVDPAFEETREVDTAMLTMRMPPARGLRSRRAVRSQRIQGHAADPSGPNVQVHPDRSRGLDASGKLPGWYERFAPTYAHELDLFVRADRRGLNVSLAAT